MKKKRKKIWFARCEAEYSLYLKSEKLLGNEKKCRRWCTSLHPTGKNTLAILLHLSVTLYKDKRKNKSIAGRKNVPKPPDVFTTVFPFKGKSKRSKTLHDTRTRKKNEWKLPWIAKKCHGPPLSPGLWVSDAAPTALQAPGTDFLGRTTGKIVF